MPVDKCAPGLRSWIMWLRTIALVRDFCWQSLNIKAAHSHNLSSLPQNLSLESSALFTIHPIYNWSSRQIFLIMDTTVGALGNSLNLICSIKRSSDQIHGKTLPQWR